MMESELTALPKKAGEAVVIRGSYWPEDEGVDVRLTARSSHTGRVVAAAHTTIPAASLDAASLTPAPTWIRLLPAAGPFLGHVPRHSRG